MNFVQRIRQLKLEELGMYKKIYAPLNIKSDEYSEEEKQNDGTVRYYKKEFLEVTDEEFERLQTGELTRDDFFNPDKHRILKFEERVVTLSLEEVKTMLENMDKFLFEVRGAKNLLEFDIQSELDKVIEFYSEKRKFLHDVYVKKLREQL